MPSEGKTIGLQINNVHTEGGADLGAGGGRRWHMRKDWSHCGLKNNAIKVMALPKIPGAIFRGDIFLQRTVKIGFHFQEKLEFSTIFKFF